MHTSQQLSSSPSSSPPSFFPKSVNLLAAPRKALSSDVKVGSAIKLEAPPAATTMAAETKENTKETEKRAAPPIPYKRLFAGAVAGIVDVWACHGFDRIKTNMQQNPKFTFVEAYQDICRKGGPTFFGGLTALYEGIFPMTLEAMGKVGLRYFAFSWFTDYWRTYVQKEQDRNAHINLTGTLLGGVFAGTVESYLAVIPCEFLKVRHMTQTSHESFYNVFRKVLREEGALALYKGGVSTWLRQVTNHMVRFPIYYSITNHLKEKSGEKKLPVATNLAVGALSGIASTYVNMPLDTIKTKQQRQGNTLTTPEIIRTMYKEEGLRGFWTGAAVRAARVAPGQAIIWAVFEKVIEIVGSDDPQH